MFREVETAQRHSNPFLPRHVRLAPSDRLPHSASLPRTAFVVFMVAAMLTKASIIGGNFMHLKFEKLNLIMLTFSPLVLAFLLFFVTFNESHSNDSHKLINHTATAPAVAAPHAEKK